MALLKLRDVGKIYVSDNNVAVGIRGVDLSFDRGEFVAVTGQSGSGKSTLLNVISGMDTYEEGEMYIEGMPTSHYMQPDWEEYRQKYISFIFQDYNIIDSFTVLENVELALMHIEDKKARRARAMELLERVGMSSHIKQKGSKLSGGQKQRTVIARALAKDSPIILADEPTGNLDSATSASIIELLREVSKDKLLIVVTHNFDEVAAYATRHVRIFDGAVESDRNVAPRETVTSQGAVAEKHTSSRKNDIKNGITLGRSIFTSRPRLSLFLCLLMIVGALGIFFVTSSSGDAMLMFEKNYMFTPIDGRVVLTRRDGAPISQTELDTISEKYGAKDTVHYDILLDENPNRFTVPDMNSYEQIGCTYILPENASVIGRQPAADREVVMSVPLYYEKYFGRDPASFGNVYMQGMKLDVVGVHYYADNNIAPQCVFTREGFELATKAYYITAQQTNIQYSLIEEKNNSKFSVMSYYNVMPSFDVPEGKVYIAKEGAKKGYSRELLFSNEYYNYNFYTSDKSNTLVFSRTLGEEYFADISLPVADMRTPTPYGGMQTYEVAMSPYLMADIADEVLAKSYRQASLFFADNDAAAVAIEGLREDGYVAVSSYETYKPDAMTAMLIVITSMLSILVWALAIAFLAFFINLCSGRTLSAFKSDMAIMRSMGISVRTIRVGMYVRMLLALIPAFVLVVVTGVLVFTIPAVNGLFAYLYAWQYALIFIGMLLLTLRVTRKQIKRLFSSSVKKALKGGAAND